MGYMVNNVAASPGLRLGRARGRCQGSLQPVDQEPDPEAPCSLMVGGCVERYTNTYLQRIHICIYIHTDMCIYIYTYIHMVNFPTTRTPLKKYTKYRYKRRFFRTQSWSCFYRLETQVSNTKSKNPKTPTSKIQNFSHLRNLACFWIFGFLDFLMFFKYIFLDF